MDKAKKLQQKRQLFVYLFRIKENNLRVAVLNRVLKLVGKNFKLHLFFFSNLFL